MVSYSGNIQIPTGGTVEAISLAIAIDGEPLQSTRMIVTPAAVENFFNVSAQAYVDVPSRLLCYGSGTEYVYAGNRSSEQQFNCGPEA